MGRDRGVGLGLVGGTGVGVPNGGVPVGVLQEIGSHPLILVVSTRQPSLEPLLSLAMRQRNLIIKPVLDILTTVVMKPAELPLQAWTACNRTTAISADNAVVAAFDEDAIFLKNIPESIPTIEAHLKHSTVKAEGRVFIGRFKIEIVAKPQVEFVHEMTEWR